MKNAGLADVKKSKDGKKKIKPWFCDGARIDEIGFKDMMKTALFDTRTFS